MVSKAEIPLFKNYSVNILLVKYENKDAENAKFKNYSVNILPP